MNSQVKGYTGRGPEGSQIQEHPFSWIISPSWHMGSVVNLEAVNPIDEGFDGDSIM
jgi:hypothetical protein